MSFDSYLQQTPTCDESDFIANPRIEAAISNKCGVLIETHIYSFGIIAVIITEEFEIKYLLVQHNNRRGNWGFPKGMIDLNEELNGHATAMREFKEEANIECSTDTIIDYDWEHPYMIKGNYIEKRDQRSINIKYDTYFVARISHDNNKIDNLVTLDPNEIKSIEWVSCETALARLNEEGKLLKQIHLRLLNAISYLKQNNNKEGIKINVFNQFKLDSNNNNQRIFDGTRSIDEAMKSFLNPPKRTKRCITDGELSRTKFGTRIQINTKTRPKNIKNRYVKDRQLSRANFGTRNQNNIKNNYKVNNVKDSKFSRANFGSRNPMLNDININNNNVIKDSGSKIAENEECILDIRDIEWCEILLKTFSMMKNKISRFGLIDYVYNNKNNNNIVTFLKKYKFISNHEIMAKFREYKLECIYPKD